YSPDFEGMLNLLERLRLVNANITVCGLRFAVCGLRFLVCGFWFAVCGLWFLVLGLLWRSLGYSGRYHASEWGLVCR
ncbi:MAG: hypothetical protein KC524_12735, partial [Gammaproteobacteria bacterium]|nr:hypothetical protein [Gammaproteobacteria bacterium]